MSFADHVYIGMTLLGEGFSFLFGVFSANNVIPNAEPNADGAIGSAVEEIALYCRRRLEYHSTKLYSKLLGTAWGVWVIALLSLITSALLCIDELLLRISTIILRVVAYCIKTIGCSIALVIGLIILMMTDVIRNIIHDFLNYTVSVAITLVLYNNFSHFCAIVCRIILGVVDLMIGPQYIFRIRNAARNLPREDVMRMQNNDIPERPNSSSQNNSNNNPDICCIACLERTKCVLFLPCKHICLCQRCANRLLNLEPPRHDCPLCRTKIVNSMVVYL